MSIYRRFINPRYVKMINHFLQSVVEKKFERKYHQEIKLTLYGISINPKSSVYDAIPKEELLPSQAIIKFFIDSEPSIHSSNFIEDLIYKEGKLFLQLQDTSWFNEPNKAFLKINLNKRPLYPLDYVVEDSIAENKLPLKTNNIKTRLLKENIESKELNWHFEKKDKKIKVIQSNDWMLQFENKTPRLLKEGQVISIPKDVYHRIIKGDGNLIIKIKEY